MSSRAADRAMDQSPMPVDPMWQQSRILIFERHDHSIALKVLKIFRECQSYTGPVAREGRVDHCVFTQLGNPGDPWIFDSPQLLRELIGVSHQSGLGVNLPVVDSVGRTGHTKVRMSGAILNATKEQRSPIAQQRRPGIEHLINQIGPIGGTQDRVELVAAKEFGRWIDHFDLVSAERNSCSLRRKSTKALRYVSLDSAT